MFLLYLFVKIVSVSNCTSIGQYKGWLVLVNAGKKSWTYIIFFLIVDIKSCTSKINKKYPAQLTIAFYEGNLGPHVVFANVKIPKIPPPQKKKKKKKVGKWAYSYPQSEDFLGF